MEQSANAEKGIIMQNQKNLKSIVFNEGETIDIVHRKEGYVEPMVVIKITDDGGLILRHPGEQVVSNLSHDLILATNFGPIKNKETVLVKRKDNSTPSPYVVEYIVKNPQLLVLRAPNTKAKFSIMDILKLYWKV